MLEARAVHFAYSPEAPVLRGASFALERGRIGALIGPNGSGKSTLIKLLAGLLRPGQGEILLEGRPLSGIPRPQIARRIGYVPQAIPISFPFTALEVVLTGRSPYTPRFRFENRADQEKAWQALATVGADQLAGRPVTELSGGERQLVFVARALCQEPDYLLLDEPSSSLDLKHRAGLLRTLNRLRSEQGLTVVLVTHDLQLLDPGVDRVAALRGGETVTAGTPAEVLRESVLARVYDDPAVRAARVEGRTFVWSELGPAP
jgi:iron complex transport system ATP-binding protein